LGYNYIQDKKWSYLNGTYHNEGWFGHLQG
jgi:hypothetical protein